MTSPRALIGLMSIVFMPAAIILLVIAGWMISRDPLPSGAVQAAQGTVVDLERSRTGINIATYRPVVVFRDAAGSERRFTGKIGSNPPDYQTGESVSVRYDPAAPEDAVIDSWSARLLAPGLTGAMGLLILWFEARVLRNALHARRRARHGD